MLLAVAATLGFAALPATALAAEVLPAAAPAAAAPTAEAPAAEASATHAVDEFFAGDGVAIDLDEPAQRDASQEIAPLWTGVTKDTFTLVIPGTFEQSKARELLALVNAARAKVGSGPLEYDENLEQIAMVRAAEIAVMFSHSRPNGQTCFSAADEMGVNSVFFCGENILCGGVYTSEFANQLWTESPGHYKNMINPGFTSVGFGAFEQNGVMFWVECFGDGGGTGFVSSPMNEYATVATEALPQFLTYVFSDIDPNDWYLSPHPDDFLYCYNSGIMTGMSNGTFGTHRSVTRGQVATILWRLAGEPQASAPAFSDVDYGAYYGKAIMWARSTGVVSGYAATNTFAPDRAVSREELVTMMRNYVLKIDGTNLPEPSSKAESMPDWNAVTEYARPAFAWAIDEGILSGVKDGGVAYLKPQSGATRISTAIMMARFHRDVLR